MCWTPALTPFVINRRYDPLRSTSFHNSGRLWTVIMEILFAPILRHTMTLIKIIYNYLTLYRDRNGNHERMRIEISIETQNRVPDF